MDAPQRRTLLRYLASSIAHAGEWVRRQVEAGDSNFIKMWNDIGDMERFDRRRRWWVANRGVFAASLS